MKQKDYVVVKQLPDAGVGTVVKWQEKSQHYVYKKSIPTWDEQLQTKIVHNVLTKEQVQDNLEFFAPIDRKYISGIDPFPDPSKLKEIQDEEESQRKRASYWEDRVSEYKKNEKHYRESLYEAHALIGRLIHYIEGRVDKVNISEYFEKPNW